MANGTVVAMRVGSSSTGISKVLVTLRNGKVSFPAGWRKSATVQHQQALRSAAFFLDARQLADGPITLEGTTDCGDVLPVVAVMQAVR